MAYWAKEMRSELGPGAILYSILFLFLVFLFLFIFKFINLNSSLAFFLIIPCHIIILFCHNMLTKYKIQHDA
jgi:hypothetical protein